jgi:hypothetical protein
MNSSDEDDPNMKPDTLEGMYTEGMDPEKGPIKLSQTQAAVQKAAAHAQKSQMISKIPRVESPMPTGSSDDDDPDSPKTVWSQSRSVFRPNKNWRDPNALALPAPEPERKPTPVSSDTEDQSEMTEGQKRYARSAKKKAGVDKSVTRSRAVTGSTPPPMSFPKAMASQRAPADIPTKGQQAPKPPVKGQESPEAKASHQMATRRQEASRAGGLRSGGGSGQTDTCVSSRNPSKT